MKSTTTSSAAQLDRQAGDRQVWFRLATPELDRDGTITLPQGIRTERYLKNPVFLWMHPLPQAAEDGSLPPPPPPSVVIGKVVAFEQTAEAFDILVEFATHDQAQLCYDLVRGGFLRAVSWSGEILRQEDRDVEGQRIPHIVELDLWEASLVIVGSNPGALALSRALAALTARSARTSPEHAASDPAPKGAPAKDQSMTKEALCEKLGVPADANRAAALRAAMKALEAEDSAEGRAALRAAMEEHYPHEEPDGDEAPPQRAAEGGEGGEGEARAAEGEGKDDVDEMDEETAKAALRMARRAAQVSPPGGGGADAKVIAEVDDLIKDGQVERDRRDEAIRLHARGKLQRALRAAGIKPGTFTTSQRLGSGRVGTPVSEDDQQRLSQRSARRPLSAEAQAQAEKDADLALAEARAQAGRK